MKNSFPNDLMSFIKNLPSLPGVYRMVNKEGVVLYVGKARHLKKRVSSYFNKNNLSSKTSSLVAQIASIEISITHSETEALLLESSLIKSLLPKYNVLMRDDKSYPFIFVNTSHPYPRIEMIRLKKKPEKGLYFGPYPSALAVRETLLLIQKIFKIRNCRDSFFNQRSRPCLQYQIKRCTAPCTAYISREAYQQSVQDAIWFLQGKSPLIMQNLSLRMEEAVARLNFEEAAILRDQMKNLRHVQESQSLIQPEGELDVVVLEAYPGFACIFVVSVREGQVIRSESFFPVVPEESLEEGLKIRQQVFDAFIAFYYVERPERIPATLIVDEDFKILSVTADVLTELRGKRCQLQTSVRGAKRRWLDFARNNLALAISEHRTSEAHMANRYQALTKFLGLSKLIARMECFDISHTQGTSTVASCVVFDAKGPLKRDYRQWNIADITAGDDYAAIEQALKRHYSRLLKEDKALPDLLIIDGGKGQVGVAARVLEQLEVKDVVLLGIAKGPERKAGWEHLIFQGLAIQLPDDSPALHLLQSIRDEAHRFAISKHRNKRQKQSLGSSLEAIEGIGAKKRQALLRHFGGRQEVAKASISEMAKVSGIGEKLARSIYEHFHMSEAVKQ